MADSELSLINKVELRIALAGTDEKFEGALKLYLAPLLLKLSSPHPEVRRAILKIIQHLIQRINAAKDIRLPIEALLSQAKNPNVSSGLEATNVVLYSLLFVARAVDRLPDSEKSSFIPIVMENISTYPSTMAARLFHILCKLTISWIPPSRGTEDADNLKELLGFTGHPDNEKFISQCFKKLFLLQPVTGAIGSNANGFVCPGLTAKDCAFLTVDAGVSCSDSSELLKVKQSAIRFLAGGFDDSNLITPLLIASCDGSSSINDTADSMFKKLHIDYEDKNLIEELINLLIGDPILGAPPVKSTIQAKIVLLLTRSKVATKSSKVSQIASIGLNSEYAKLKSNTIQFIKWVTIKSDLTNETSSDFTMNIAAQLKENLMTEGWPKINTAAISNYTSAIKQRRSQYEALGTVLKSNANLILCDLSYIEFLFSSLEGETAELRPTIQDSLSGLTTHLPNLATSIKEPLKYFLKRYFDSSVQGDLENVLACRYTAVKYINCTFNFDDPEARFLCLLGSSQENRSDIIEEAEKGLHPHWFNILQASNSNEFKPTSELLGAKNDVVFPSFHSLVHLFNKEIIDNRRVNKINVLFKSSIIRIVNFIFQTLVMQSIRGITTVVVSDEEWTTRLEKASEFDDTVKSLIKKEIMKISFNDVDMDSVTDNSTIALFLRLTFDEFVQKSENGKRISLSDGSNFIFGKIFNKLLSLSPSSVVESFVGDVSRLLNTMNGSSIVSDDMSLQIAKALGIIASHSSMTSNNISETYERLLDIKIEKSPIAQILALGYLSSRLIFRGRLSEISESTYERLMALLFGSLEDQRLYHCAVESIGQMAMFGAFGPVIKIGNRNQFDKFLPAIKAKTKKFDEKSIITWGYLSLSDDAPSTTELTEYEKVIFEAHDSKQIEFLFSSGEALSVVASSWDSKVLNRNIDIGDATIEFLPRRTTRLSRILVNVLKSCESTKPSLRRAGCIWLLSLVQYCGHLNIVKEKAAEIHVCFMKFLSDRDELIQESASRGLSIVYEMGDSDLKDLLVHGLLTSFTDSGSTSKLSAGTVSEETQLFEPGLLKTNDGSVSTYKDILNLASEVGDPGLVYKFMSLARSSALWTSRKGIAFGLGSILSKSSLDDLLVKNKSLSEKLIPKLYRYRFDPISSVATSMNDIWNSLISDSSKTVISNFESILKELLRGMGDREWRVRQASTTALMDLVQCVSLDVYEPRLEDIWNMSFRAMDDIKESVRKEGAKLTRNLASTLVSSIDENSGGSRNRATEVLSSLIPFLMSNKGMLSDAEEVKNFALSTILTLCKKTGPAIKPFIPTLMYQFINLMSTLEPQVINYLSLNASKYNLHANDIDTKRLQSVGNSPMMDAIEKMVDLIDDDLMKEVVPQIKKAVRKSIGLPSKVAGSRVIVSFIVRHLQSVQGEGETLLDTCIQQLSDRNDTIASSYATAAGYVCRVCDIKSVIAFSEIIKKMYFQSEQEKGRYISAVASEAVSKYAGDKFSSVSAAFLPLAFVAKHDPVDTISEIFEREWNENSSGNGSVKLFIKEISELVHENLNSPQYIVRQTIAKSVASACDAIDDAYTMGSSSSSLFEMLIEACQGRSWSGKELVLNALVELSIKSQVFVSSSEDKNLLIRINKVVLTEAKRRNRDYQKHSIKAFGKYLSFFPDEYLIEEYITIMSSIISDDYYDDSDSSENENNDAKINALNKKSSRLNIKREEERIAFLQSLVHSFSINENISENLLVFILKSIRQLFRSQIISISWRSQISSCESFSYILRKIVDHDLPVKESELVIDEMKLTWSLLFENCGGIKEIENVRFQFVKTSHLFIRALANIQNDRIVLIKQVVGDGLQKMLNMETSTVVKAEINRNY